MKYSEYSNIVSGKTFYPELATYISGLSTPLSAGQKIVTNTLIGNLNLGLGISTLIQGFDLIYYLAQETSESALRNLVRRSFDSTLVNSPSFDPLNGFTGSSGKYIRTNYKPVTNGTNYSQNNVAIGFYSKTGSTTNGAMAMAARMASSPWTCLQIGAGGTNLHPAVVLNDNIGVQIDSITTTEGCFIASRTESGSFRFSRNKVKKTYTAATNGTLDIEIALLGMFQGASGYSNYDGQISFAFLSRGLSDAEIDAVNDAIVLACG
jgi:hypothetical protein